MHLKKLRGTMLSDPPEERSLNAAPNVVTRPSGLNVTGVSVTERSALSVTAAFACINVISTDTAYPPCRVMFKSSDGSRTERTDHPADPLLRYSPDGEATTMGARQAWMAHALGWGNGYQEIETDLFGRPAALHRLDPATTDAKRRKSDKRLYYAVDGGASTLRPAKVLHLAGLGFDGLIGYSPIRLARQAFGLALATETFGASLFGNGAHPKGVLTHPSTMSDEAWDTFRERFDAVHQGVGNGNRLLLLEEGMSWLNTSINPDDAQFLATRMFQVLEICRLYRVPPHKVGDYSQSHLSNIEASNIDYLQTVLAPWCERIEQTLSMKLLTEDERQRGFYIEHALAAFLRGDSKSRGEFYKTLRDLGVITPNQIAAMEGMNPIGPEGDIRLVPLNMTTLANAGKPVPKDMPTKGTRDAAA